ncbi:hypothetical protein [Methanoculleus sp.]|uniref:hypothetical protein n=1 Tax=Methanoculleus sp. TaxID=90427 RepID=UPI002FC5D6CB
MKQPEIIVGIVFALALAVGVVYATGGFDEWVLDNTTGMDSVIVKDTVVSQTIDNTTNPAGNVTNASGMPTLGEENEREPGIVNEIKVLISNVVNAYSSGGSATSRSSSSSGSKSSSSSRSKSSSSSAIPTVTPSPTATTCPITDPTCEPTANVTVTPTCTETVTTAPASKPTTNHPTTTATPSPTATTTATPDPTLTPEPTPEIIHLTGTGTAGVHRDYYIIFDHSAETSDIIVESMFPPEISGEQSLSTITSIYHFATVELRHIYRYFVEPNAGENGVGTGGWNLGNRQGIAKFGYEYYYYPIVNTAILIYSDDVPFYVVSTADFTATGLGGYGYDPYSGESHYIPCEFYRLDYEETIPKTDPYEPRYYNLPHKAPSNEFHPEYYTPNPYLPATPEPDPTYLSESPQEPGPTPPPQEPEFTPDPVDDPGMDGVTPPPQTPVDEPVDEPTPVDEPEDELEDEPVDELEDEPIDEPEDESPEEEDIPPTLASDPSIGENLPVENET